MKREKYKPGPGWKRFPNAPVWEHKSGVRVHLFGTYREVAGIIAKIPHRELALYRRICAGRTPRAIMAWAKDNII